MQKHQDRILFLREFTKQLIINSAPQQAEKTEEMPAIKTAEIMVPVPKEFQKSIAEPISQQIPAKPLINPLIRTRIPIRQIIMPVKYNIKPRVSGFTPSIASKTQTIPVQPSPSPIPEGFNLDKLNFLISDPRVTVIECPGPEKFILAKTSGQVTLTKISLSQEEISRIIEKFSKEAKIPVISGLFKAAVGDLILTAVISELIGSRFIITKITPGFILEQQGFG